MFFERDDQIKRTAGTIAFCVFFVVLCVCTAVFFPETVAESNDDIIPEQIVKQDADAEDVDYKRLFDEEYPQLVLDFGHKDDAGLVMYRQAGTRPAVEWYYTRIVNSREVALAILEEADEYSIPLSLAFALAHTESRFNLKAMHKNTNGTIDRGLFQLNSATFPKLSETDFYDPKISAKYGLSHLRFCLNSAGNEIAALAMYNAGSNKVKKNNTPQITLNYISMIQGYRSRLDEAFASEVMAFYYNGDSNHLAKK